MEVKVIYGDTVLAEVPLSGAVTDKISRATEALRWVERATKTIGPVRIASHHEGFCCIVNIRGPVLTWDRIEGGGASDAISAIEGVRKLIEGGWPEVHSEYTENDDGVTWLPDRTVNGVNVDAARRASMKAELIDALQRTFNVVNNYRDDTKSILRYIREEIAKHEGE